MKDAYLLRMWWNTRFRVPLVIKLKALKLLKSVVEKCRSESWLVPQAAQLRQLTYCMLLAFEFLTNNKVQILVELVSWIFNKFHFNYYSHLLSSLIWYPTVFPSLSPLSVETLSATEIAEILLGWVQTTRQGTELAAEFSKIYCGTWKNRKKRYSKEDKKSKVIIIILDDQRKRRRRK